MESYFDAATALGSHLTPLTGESGLMLCWEAT